MCFSGILGHPEDKFVLLDNDITLSCQLNDSATISWYHNDSPIGPGVTSIEVGGDWRGHCKILAHSSKGFFFRWNLSFFEDLYVPILF